LNKRSKIITISVIAALIVTGFIIGSIYVWNSFRGALPALTEPSQDIAELLEQVDYEKNSFPLKTMPGFEVSLFADGIEGARVLEIDDSGDIWLSQTSEGIISKISVIDGEASETEVIFEGLREPHGLAFDPEDTSMLYIAEEDAISRVDIDGDMVLEKIIELPPGGRHFTRTIVFGPGSRMYISIGSTCDVCEEKDYRHGKIFVMNKDGTGFTEYASGLRNAVFMEFRDESGQLWVTEMGRDFLGDDLPPDEINIIIAGKDYGWPYCYGKNVPDEKFIETEKQREGCNNSEPSHIDLQAHSAPLGLDFFPSASFDAGYAGDLLVAYHGSWNRTTPTGYKIVYFDLDKDGGLIGSKDFITGWLTDDGEVLGRPVDIMITEGGKIYISDDKAGIIYEVSGD